MILSGPEGHNFGNPVNEPSVMWLIHEKGYSFMVTLVFYPLLGLSMNCETGSDLWRFM